MNTPAFLSDRLKNEQFTRIVAFGSSNTQRRIAGMHWFDCFELACRNTLGHQIACINSGNGGDSTVDLLRQFERDCLAHHPNIAFITIGGNDSHPDNGISVTAYRDNLRHIIQQIQACDCRPVVQTYYACDLAAIPPRQAAAFVEMMEVARELSRETGCMLIDHLTRWQRLQKSRYDSYRGLMLDAMHVNRAGNLVLGLDIAREFSLPPPTIRISTMQGPCRRCWTN